MYSKILWLFLVIRATSLGAEKFYVSEIFLNTGFDKDNKTQWLELHNISERSLIINNLKIEIQAGDLSPRIIEARIESPVIFDERLIIASNKDLGLGICLDNHVNLIVPDNFYIKKAKKLNICISINQEKICLNLAPNLFAEKTSFYKSITGPWRSEPCSLLQGIYATPGLPEQACLLNPDFALEILKDCNSSLLQSNTINLTQESKSKPSIISAHISRSDNLDVRFKDNDVSDLWRLSYCSAPKTSKLICHELSEPLSVGAAQENIIKMPVYLEKNNQKLRVLVRDLYGLSDSADVLMESENNIVTNQYQHIKNQLLSTGVNQFRLELSLEAAHVPVNTQILSASGEVLAQRAFMRPGVNDLTFFTKESVAKLNVVSKFQSYDEDLELKNGLEKESPSCATHDSNFLWLIAYIALIRRRSLRNIIYSVGDKS